MLDVGITLMEQVPDYTLKRDALVARHARRQDASAAVDRGVPRRRIDRAALQNRDEGPARLDQLLSAVRRTA
mgnify:CR=1 FL=1